MGQRSQLRLGAPAEFPQDMEREPGVPAETGEGSTFVWRKQVFFFLQDFSIYLSNFQGWSCT